MARESFVGGGYFEKLRLGERTAQEFHTDRKLSRSRAREPAPVGVCRIRHAVVNDFREAGGNNN